MNKKSNIVKGNIVKQEDIVQENVVQENVVQENVVQENVVQENVVQENVVQENVVQENVVQENVVQENIVHVHLVSDSTSDTLNSLLHAVVNGYDADFKEHLYPAVRNQQKLQNAMERIEEYGGVVLTTLVDDEAQKTIARFCEKKGFKCMPALEPLTRFFDEYLGQKVKRKVGSKYTLDDRYFARIAALNYTIEHDDGAKLDTIHQADIVLLGISRTSKTPTSVYLAHRGYKVANIPFIMQARQNLPLLNYGNAFIVGLVAAPTRIMQVRQNRILQINADANSDYANLRMIIEEVRESKNLFENIKIPYIDVTRRSIEETAAMIIQMGAEKLGYR